MKEIMNDINNIEELPKNKDKIVEMKIEAHDFDIDECGYLTVDDITDKDIGYLERQIRNSYEYKSYIEYLKTELDLNQCKLLPQLDLMENPVGLEMHHYPFTLYDITNIISRQMISKAEEDGSGAVSSFDIAERVMKEHYENNVGLIPLTSTLHQMAHNKSLIIPLEYVNGNYGNFINKYSEYIDDDTRNKLNEELIASDSEDARELNELKLQKKIIHYNIEYAGPEDPDDIDDYEF